MYVKRNIKVARKANRVLQGSNIDDIEGEGDFLDPEELREATKTLCYEDVTLVLLPNPAGLRDILAIEVNL